LHGMQDLGIRMFIAGGLREIDKYQTLSGSGFPT
jgi:hypothetical protein